MKNNRNYNLNKKNEGKEYHLDNNYKLSKNNKGKGYNSYNNNNNLGKNMSGGGIL